MTPIPICRIDHIAVTAPTLEAGAAWVEQVLGVVPQPGGAHPQMGTHNVLLRLGDDVYLEVIAVDPHAPGPDRPRWFGLDALEPGSKPCVRTWIARCTEIQTALAGAGEPLGQITEMRRGDLQWLITIPEDGKPPMGGVAPALIEWKTGPHPATRLQDHGLSLERLVLVHPRPHRVMALLQAIGMNVMVQVQRSPEGEGSSLLAQINTPMGRRNLSVAV